MSKLKSLNLTKSLILQEQKGLNVERLVEDISMGKSPLLKAEVIAERLDVPLDTFHQWVRNGDPSYAIPTTMRAIGRVLIGESPFDEPKNIIFPKPDIYIGSSPRWTLQTFQSWIRTQIK